MTDEPDTFNPAEIAASLTPAQREILRNASCGCIAGARGGSTYRAFARRGLTWPTANFLLTDLGRAVAAELSEED